MATKVNVKFVGILVGVVVFLSALAIGVYFYVQRGNPEQNVNAAQELEATAQKQEEQRKQLIDPILARATELRRKIQATDNEIIKVLQNQDASLESSERAAKLASLNQQLIDHRENLLKTLNELNQSEEIAEIEEKLAKNYREAVSQWGAAIGKDKSNLEYKQSLLNLLERTKVKMPQDIKKNLGWYNQTLREITDESDGQAKEEAFRQELAARARQLYITGGDWSGILSRAEEWLNNRPDSIVAKKYRGIAQVMRMVSQINVVPKKRADAQSDLLATLEADPSDVDARFALAQWHIQEYKRYSQPGGDPKEAAINLRNAAATIIEPLTDRQVSEYTKDDLPLLIRAAFILAQEGMSQQQKDNALEFVKRAEELAMDNPLNVVDARWYEIVTPVLDSTPAQAPGGSMTRHGNLRVERVLQKAVENDPDNLGLMMLLGEIQLEQSKTTAASNTFWALYSFDRALPPFEAHLARFRRPMAGLYWAEATVRSLDGKTLDERQAILKESNINQVMGDIKKEQGGVTNPLAVFVQGWIDYHNRNWTGVKKLYPTNVEHWRTSNDMHRYVQALTLVAQASANTGETGAAVNRYEEIRKLIPTHGPTISALGRLYLSQNQPEKVLNMVNGLETIDPDNPLIPQLRASAYDRQGKSEEARQILEKLDLNQYASLQPLYLKVLVDTGRKNQAVEILTRHLDENPDDYQSLLRLKQLLGEERPELYEKYLASAREAGLSEKQERRMVAWSEGDIESVQMEAIEELKDTDPIRYHISMYEYLKQRDKNDEALEHLYKARDYRGEDGASGAKDPVVVERLFNEAIREGIESGDFSKASNLASAASRADLDQAGGAFYMGRLYLARSGQDREYLTRAVSSIRQGLTATNLYSDGYALLGEALKQQGDVDGAIDAYNRAIELKPGNYRASIALARLYQEQRKTEESLSVLRRSVKTLPDRVDLLRFYIAMEQAIGDPALAVQAHKHLMNLVGENVSTRVAHAVLLARAKKYNEAGTLLEEIIQSNPDRRDARLARAQVYSEQGRSDFGDRYLQVYVDGLGDQAVERDWIMLAEYRQAIGDQNGAGQAWQKAIELEGEDMLASRAYANILFRQSESDTREDLVNLLRRIVQADSEDLAARLMLIDTLVSQGQIPAAENEIQKYQAMSVVRENKPLQARGQVRESQVLLNKAQDQRRMMLQSKRIGQGGQAEQYRVQMQELLNTAKSRLNSAISNLGQDTATKSRAYFLRATIHKADGSIDNAKNDLQQAITLDDGYSRAKLELAAIKAGEGDIVNSLNDLLVLLDENPRYLPARFALLELFKRAGGRDARLLQILQEAITLYPKDSRWQLELAIYQEKAGDLRAAIESFKTAWEIEQNPQTLTSYSRALVEAERYREAERLIRDQASLTREYPPLWAIRATALMKQDKKAEAANASRLSIEQCKNFPQAWASTTQLLIAWEGQSDELLSILDSIETNDQDMKNWIDMCRVVVIQNEGKTKDSIALLDALQQRLSELSLEYDWVLRRKASLLLKDGQDEKAIALYVAFHERNPDDPDVLNNLAFGLIGLGRPTQAIKYAEQAAQLKPKDANVLDTLGWTYYQAGKKTDDRALQQRGKSILTDSYNLMPLPANCYHLGIIELEQKNKTAAENYLKRSQDLSDKYNDLETREQARKALLRLERL